MANVSDQTIANIVSWILCIGLVIGAIILDMSRNPLKHSKTFHNYRTLNWVIVGLSYASLYMGRYNISTSNTQ